MEEHPSLTLECLRTRESRHEEGVTSTARSNLATGVQVVLASPDLPVPPGKILVLDPTLFVRARDALR